MLLYNGEKAWWYNNCSCRTQHKTTKVLHGELHRIASSKNTTLHHGGTGTLNYTIGIAGTSASYHQNRSKLLGMWILNKLSCIPISAGGLCM